MGIHGVCHSIPLHFTVNHRYLLDKPQYFKFCVLQSAISCTWRWPFGTRHYASTNWRPTSPPVIRLQSCGMLVDARFIGPTWADIVGSTCRGWDRSGFRLSRSGIASTKSPGWPLMGIRAGYFDASSVRHGEAHHAFIFCLPCESVSLSLSLLLSLCISFS